MSNIINHLDFTDIYKKYQTHNCRIYIFKCTWNIHQDNYAETENGSQKIPND